MTGLYIFSLEQIAAVGYAIMTTRSPDIPWQMRAARVLPMFLVPALAALIYSAITSIAKFRKYICLCISVFIAVVLLLLILFGKVYVGLKPAVADVNVALRIIGYPCDRWNKKETQLYSIRLICFA